MEPIVVNEVSDFTTNPVVIPAGYLVTITDRYGNVQGHRLTSATVDQTATSYATDYATAYFAPLFPLTITFSPDPNYVAVTPPSTC